MVNHTPQSLLSNRLTAGPQSQTGCLEEVKNLPLPEFRLQLLGHPARYYTDRALQPFLHIFYSPGCLCGELLVFRLNPEL